MFKLLIASLKMKFRDRTSLFYALIFPVIFLTVFGLFDMDKMGEVKFAIVNSSQNPLSVNVIENLKKIESFKIEESTNLEEAKEKLKNQKFDAVLEFQDTLFPTATTPENVTATGLPQPKVNIKTYYNEENLQTNQIIFTALSQIANETNVAVANTPKIIEIEKQALKTKTVNYFDFLFPGILGMSVMMYAIMNVAVGITKYRELGILKRLLATPLRIRNFFLAEISSYLVIATIQVALVLTMSIYVFHANIYGSIPLIFGVVVLGNIIFLNLGFIISGLSKNVNGAEGLANIFALPMMFLSGTFFPTESLPSIVQAVVKYLPLTPLLEILRKSALSGEAVLAQKTSLLILVAWIFGSSILAVKLFKFRED